MWQSLYAYDPYMYLYLKKKTNRFSYLVIKKNTLNQFFNLRQKIEKAIKVSFIRVEW